MTKASYFIKMYQFVFQFNKKKNILLFGKQNLLTIQADKVNGKEIDQKGEKWQNNGLL